MTTERSAPPPTRSGRAARAPGGRRIAAFLVDYLVMARYAEYEREFEDEEPVIDACRTRLAEIVREVGTRFVYVYDFGDD